MSLLLPTTMTVALAILYAVQHEAAPGAPEDALCIGGQATEPYEQNTQQSPCFDRNRTPQPVHS
jgi:hypothetical protein